MGTSAFDSIRTGWWGPIAWTLLGPLVCMLVAVWFNFMLFSDSPADAFDKAILSAILLPWCLGSPLFLFFSLKLRELAIANIKLGIVAATDGLTACLNRNAFTAIVEERIADGPRCARPGALLIVDADRFKQINDRLGHQAGDRALEMIAETLRNTVRRGDIVGRMGGEEFGVFLPSLDRVSAARVAERLRTAIEAAVFEADGMRWPLSVSIGGVVFDEATTFETLFSQADERLYYAKQAGRNCVAMTSLAAQVPTVSQATA